MTNWFYMYRSKARPSYLTDLKSWILCFEAFTIWIYEGLNLKFLIIYGSIYSSGTPIFWAVYKASSNVIPVSSLMFSIPSQNLPYQYTNKADAVNLIFLFKRYCSIIIHVVIAAQDPNSFCSLTELKLSTSLYFRSPLHLGDYIS